MRLTCYGSESQIRRKNRRYNLTLQIQRVAGMKEIKRFQLLGAALLLLCGGLQQGAAGQEPRDSFPGVALGLLYETSYQPALAIKSFTSRFGGGGVGTETETIIAQDLRFSDRFEMMDSLPASLLGEGVDYNLWDQMGATWLLTGQVESLGEGFVLVLQLHNVVYAEVREQARFPLPDPASEDFRMAVHRVSDQVVEWIFEEPGMAASRIAFSRVLEGGAQEIYVVDSDGENLRGLRITAGSPCPRPGTPPGRSWPLPPTPTMRPA